MKKLFVVFSGSLVLAFMGCSSIPDYKPPKVESPPEFKEGAMFKASLHNATLKAETAPDAWWELFNDSVLNDLEARAIKGNQNLAGSAAAVRLAMAATGSANAALYPTVNLGGSGNRANIVTAASPQGTTVTAQASMSSWELDVWDRLGANAKSAAFKEQASQATLASARLSLQASVASTYFSLRSAEALEAVLAKSMDAYAKSLELTQNRYAGGVATVSYTHLTLPTIYSV